MRIERREEAEEVFSMGATANVVVGDKEVRSSASGANGVWRGFKVTRGICE